MSSKNSYVIYDKKWIHNLIFYFISHRAIQFMHYAIYIYCCIERNRVFIGGKVGHLFTRYKVQRYKAPHRMLGAGSLAWAEPASGKLSQSPFLSLIYDTGNSLFPPLPQPGWLGGGGGDRWLYILTSARLPNWQLSWTFTFTDNALAPRSGKSARQMWWRVPWKCPMYVSATLCAIDACSIISFCYTGDFYGLMCGRRICNEVRRGKQGAYWTNNFQICLTISYINYC